MKPLVLYMGGKRKLAPTIIPFLNLREGRRYYEPYTGMGAVYLALRGEGWRGEAVLRDTNYGVTAVWECLHDFQKAARLREALLEWVDVERTNAHWKSLVGGPVPSDVVERAAQWLWLQEGAYGGVPVGCDGTGWMGSGCAFDSHSSRRASGLSANTHDVGLLLKKLAALQPLRGLPVQVETGAFQTVTSVDPGSVVYGDPPYEVQEAYKGLVGKGTHMGHRASFVDHARVVISEQTALCPEGFEEVWRGERTQRVRGHGASDCTERILVGGLE